MASLPRGRERSVQRHPGKQKVVRHCSLGVGERPCPSRNGKSHCLSVWLAVNSCFTSRTMQHTEQGKVENLLRELGKKIDQLIEEGKKASSGLSGEVEEKIKELKIQKEKLEADFEEFKKKNEPRWKEAREHLEVAIQEIKQAAEAAFRNMRK